MGRLARGARSVRQCGRGWRVDSLGLVFNQLQLAFCALAVLSQRLGTFHANSAEWPDLYRRLCTDDYARQGWRNAAQGFLKSAGNALHTKHRSLFQ